MTLQTITLRLPEMLYRQVEHRAQRMRRSVEDELIIVVSTALPTTDDLPLDIAGLVGVQEDRVSRQTIRPGRSWRLREN